MKDNFWLLSILMLGAVVENVQSLNVTTNRRL